MTEQDRMNLIKRLWEEATTIEELSLLTGLSEDHIGEHVAGPKTEWKAVLSMTFTATKEITVEARNEDEAADLCAELSEHITVTDGDLDFEAQPEDVFWDIREA